MNPEQKTTLQDEKTPIQQAIEKGVFGTEPPAPAPQETKPLPTWLVTAVIVVGIAAALAYFFGDGVIRFLVGNATQQSGLPPELDVHTIVAESRTGNYAGAVEQYEKIIASTPTPEEKVWAVKNSLEPRYRATGDPAEYVKTVTDLKIAVADETIPPYSRAQAIGTIANAFSQSGEDPHVFEEIFLGEPFASMRDDASPLRSIRNVHEFAYGIYPTPKTGIAIAASYVREVINTPQLPSSTKDEYIAAAKKYLAEAEALSENDPVFQDPLSRGLVGYKVWRAFTVGALNHLNETVPTTEYRSEYGKLEQHFEGLQNVQAQQYKPFAHWMYATFLLLDKEPTARVKAEIEKAVSFYDQDSEKNINEFATYMRNWKAKGEDGLNDFVTGEIPTLMKLSPRFAQFIAGL